jgi:hypothetical protein
MNMCGKYYLKVLLVFRKLLAIIFQILFAKIFAKLLEKKSKHESMPKI